MTGPAGESDLLRGVEGLALLRDAVARTRPERSVAQGYAEWSTTYDRPGNALIQLEEIVLLPLLDAQPAGRALDAACGTGRVTAHLAAAGHDVLGVDASPEMLDVARAKVPAARFAEGRLEALPVEDERFDLVVCCLALSNCEDVGAPIAELARAARRGGRVIITDLHPAMVHLGGQAAYVDADGGQGFVRAHPHVHGDYLRAFASGGLSVDDLIEPPPNQAWFEQQPALWSAVPDAFRAAFDGIPAAIVWSLVKA